MLPPSMFGTISTSARDRRRDTLNPHGLQIAASRSSSPALRHFELRPDALPTNIAHFEHGGGGSYHPEMRSVRLCPKLIARGCRGCPLLQSAGLGIRVPPDRLSIQATRHLTQLNCPRRIAHLSCQSSKSNFRTTRSQLPNKGSISRMSRRHARAPGKSPTSFERRASSRTVSRIGK
jgi:hypothetical protein